MAPTRHFPSPGGKGAPRLFFAGRLLFPVFNPRSEPVLRPPDRPGGERRSRDLHGAVAIDTLKTALDLATAALDKKAVNPSMLEVKDLVSYADYLLLVTTTSGPHAKAVAEACIKCAKVSGVELLASEGLESARWILLDFGDVVVHIFQPLERGYYDLETLWLEAPRVEIPGSEDATDNDAVYFAPR
ncbi:MAG: ribosome silencing factor [Myxococcota bacterium]|nr:ribosome silencing factor [Myxococcota bacterium]